MFRSITGKPQRLHKSKVLWIPSRGNAKVSIELEKAPQPRARGIPLATEWDGIDLLAVKQAPFASSLAKSRPTAKKGLNQLFRNERNNQHIRNPNNVQSSVVASGSAERNQFTQNSANSSPDLLKEKTLGDQQDRSSRSAVSTEVPNDNRAQSANRASIQRFKPRADDPERRIAAKWSRMTREDEDFKAAFLANPINIQTIPKFDILHPRDSDFINPNRLINRREPAVAGRNLNSRTRNTRDRRPPRTNPGVSTASHTKPREEARKPSLTVLAVQNLVNESINRPETSIDALTEPTSLTDFNRLFYKSPFSQTVSATTGEIQGPESSEIEINNYDQYRPILEDQLAVDSIVPNARLLVSRHRNLDLNSRQKALDIIKKYDRQEKGHSSAHA